MASIEEVAATGDRRATLEAMRAKLAADMDAAPPAVVAQIAGRLSALLAEIAELPDGQVRSELDELLQRRQERLAGTKAPQRTKGKPVKRGA
jgi:hypothetical protein